VSAGRLPWLRPADLDEAQQEVYGAIIGGLRSSVPRGFPLTDGEGRLQGPFNAMLFSPPLGMALQQLGEVIRHRTSLGARSREIAILEVARAEASEYEWLAHADAGRRAGLTEDQIGAVRDGQAAAGLTAAEETVRLLATELVTSGDLSGPTLGQAEDVLGLQALTEVVFLVGYYRMVALSLRVWRVPLPQTDRT
jgi:4-carboxymuconolactone decarboxylase